MVALFASVPSFSISWNWLEGGNWRSLRDLPQIARDL
jgi:hypothetical protein